MPFILLFYIPYRTHSPLGIPIDTLLIQGSLVKKKKVSVLFRLEKELGG